MNNITDVDECDIFFSTNDYISLSRNETLVFPLLAGVIIVFGILNNWSCLFVVYRVRVLHTVTNCYLANLAVADLGLLIFEALSLITSALNYRQYDVGYFAFKSDWSCTSGSILIYTSYFGCVFFVTVVLFDRYMSICHPLRYLIIKGKGNAMWITSGLWLSSLSMAVFSIGVTKHSLGFIKDYNESVIATISICYWYDFGFWMDSIKLTLELGQYLIAGALGVFMMIRIIYKLSNRLVTHESAKLSVMNTRNQVARMLVVNAVVFFSCYFPFKLLDITSVVGIFTGYTMLPNIRVFLGWWGRLAMLLYASLNPILYNMTNSQYRKAYRKALY